MSFRHNTIENNRNQGDWFQIGSERIVAMTITKKASGKWQARYTDPEGLRRSLGTYQTKLAAERALREVLQDIDRGTWELTRDSFRAAKEGKSLTLDQVAERYRKLGTRGGKALSPRTLGEYERYLSRDLIAMQHSPIRSITRQKIESWWIEYGDTRSVLRQRVYSHLNSVMRYALDSGFIAENPCRIRGAGSVQTRVAEVVATRTEAAAILEASPPKLKALFAIALWGGLRKGELLELRRKDLEYHDQLGYTISIQRAVVWLPEGLIQVREPKWSSRRKVALPGAISEVISSHLKTMETIDPEGLLFPYQHDFNRHYPNHALNRLWEKIRNETGYRGSIHSLRHFAGTSYGMTGATLREIMDRLGHSNTRTAMLYQKNSGRELELVQRMDLMI